MFGKKIIYLLLFLIILSCNNRQKQVHAAFYYWKTNFESSKQERQLLQATNCGYLYVRFFDIDLDMASGRPVPVGILKAEQLHSSGQKIIPVVYLTQRCLSKFTASEVPLMAQQTAGLIRALCKKYVINPGEIQLDCDWTKNTKTLYFGFLKELRRQPFLLHKELSCTIRMHQVKYVSQSGVPPADRGMLMCYNMGNMKKYGGHNSILEVSEAEAYMNNMEHYPLKLDIALPLFHWAVLFGRRRFKGIAYNISREDFNDNMLKQITGNLYRIGKDTGIKGYVFREGEEIRFEQPLQDDLEYIARYAGKHINNSDFRAAFFHLDSTAVTGFPAIELNRILKNF